MWKPITEFLKFQCKMFTEMFNVLIDYFGEHKNKDIKEYSDRFTIDELADTFRHIIYHKDSTFFVDYQAKGKDYRDVITVGDIDTPYGKVYGEGESLFEAIMDFDKNYRKMKTAKLAFKDIIHDMKQENYTTKQLDDYGYYEPKDRECKNLEDVHTKQGGIFFDNT